jgi:hypothetical protein
MQRTTALAVLLCFAPAAVHADELATQPPGTMRKNALYEESWHLWWDKPGFGGPIAWSLIGTAAMAGGVGVAGVVISDARRASTQSGEVAAPVLLLLGGGLVLTLAIVWWAKRVADREAYETRMRALTDELSLRNLPPPGAGP